MATNPCMVASKWRCDQPKSKTSPKSPEMGSMNHPQMVGLFFGLTPEVRFDDFQSLCTWTTLRISWHHNVITSISQAPLFQHRPPATFFFLLPSTQVKFPNSTSFRPKKIPKNSHGPTAPGKITLLVKTPSQPAGHDLARLE